MIVKQVIEKYHKLVPFPISSAKVKRAGYTVEQYLQNITTELNKCSDKKDGKNKKLIASLNKTLAELKKTHEVEPC